MEQPSPPTLKVFPAAKQRLLDELLEKNAEGMITSQEKADLEVLVNEAEALMVDNARQLAEFASRQSPRPPLAAVPVTVWVSPQTTEH